MAKTKQPKKKTRTKSSDWFGRVMSPVLKSLRKSRSLSQRELSELTGSVVDDRTLSNFESGTEPRLTDYLALCAALGVHPLDILPPALKRAIEKHNPASIAATVLST